MKAHWTYLKYVLRHKWFVFLECCRLGIPWMGIIHDIGKFSRAEWRPYVLSFYSGWKKDERPQWVVLLYDKALQHHLDHNKHHPEYWHIGGGVFQMPDRYLREMLADWRGAGLAKGKPDTWAWYQKNKDKIILDSTSRKWVEERLRK